MALRENIEKAALDAHKTALERLKSEAAAQNLRFKERSFHLRVSRAKQYCEDLPLAYGKKLFSSSEYSAILAKDTTDPAGALLDAIEKKRHEKKLASIQHIYERKLEGSIKSGDTIFSLLRRFFMEKTGSHHPVVDALIACCRLTERGHNVNYIENGATRFRISNGHLTIFKGNSISMKGLITCKAKPATNEKQEARAWFMRRGKELQKPEMLKQGWFSRLIGRKVPQAKVTENEPADIRAEIPWGRNLYRNIYSDLIDHSRSKHTTLFSLEKNQKIILEKPKSALYPKYFPNLRTLNLATLHYETSKSYIRTFGRGKRLWALPFTLNGIVVGYLAYEKGKYYVQSLNKSGKKHEFVHYSKSYGNPRDALKQVYLAVKIGAPIIMKDFGKRFGEMLTSSFATKQARVRYVSNSPGAHLGEHTFVYTFNGKRCEIRYDIAANKMHLKSSKREVTIMMDTKNFCLDKQKSVEIMAEHVRTFIMPKSAKPKYTKITKPALLTPQHQYDTKYSETFKAAIKKVSASATISQNIRFAVEKGGKFIQVFYQKGPKTIHYLRKFSTSLTQKQIETGLKAALNTYIRYHNIR